MRVSMKIINISPHFHIKGGSDSYFLAQSRLLEEHGIEVAPFCVKSKKNGDSKWAEFFVDGIDLSSPSFADVFSYCYSFEARDKLRSLIKVFKPDLVHLHIFYGNFTSSILSVIKSEFGLPVVQTVHDYKPVCPVYSLTRDGVICEECEGKHFWRALSRKCNRGSLARTAVSVLESYVSKKFGNIDLIDRFIAVSDFQADRLRSLGVPAERLRVLHNFSEVDSSAARLDAPSLPRFLYFGRIERSKGVFDILHAAKALPNCIFVLAGNGSALSEAREFVANNGLGNVEIPGFVGGEGLADLIRSSTATLLIPTVYENCPMSVLESLALGVPVVGSRMGGIPELVSDGVDGLVVSPGNVDELIIALNSFLTDETRSVRMGAAGIEKVLKHFSPPTHFEGLMRIYSELLPSVEKETV